MAYYSQLYSGDESFQTGSGYNRGIEIYRGPLTQTGTGYNLGIEIYRGPLYRQSGAGLGNFFNTAIRYLRPLLSSGINAITNQGVKSAGSILSQLGSKDLKTILNEEGEKTVRNLSEKAIRKLRRARGETSTEQLGSGEMPIGLSPLQLQRLVGQPKSQIALKRKKPISNRQLSHKRKIGTSIKRVTKRSRQIGKGRKRIKKQIGEGRRRKRQSHKARSYKKKKLRTLDIFN